MIEMISETREVCMKNIEKLGFKHSKKGTRGKGFEINNIESIFISKFIPHLRKQYRIEFYNIFVITEGEGVHEIDFREYPLKKGDIMFVAKRRVHRFVEFENIKGYVLIFTDEFLFEFLKDQSRDVLELFNKTYLNPILPAVQFDDYVFIDQAKLLLEIYRENDNRFDFNVLTFAFRTIIAMVKKRVFSFEILKKKNNHIFLEFSKLVDDNLSEIKTVESYAEMLHVSKKTVNQVTRKSVDMSAKQFIIDKTIHRIKINLCFEEKTIDEIADELGFSESYNLTKFFKKYTNQTPTEFRKISK